MLPFWWAPSQQKLGPFGLSVARFWTQWRCLTQLSKAVVLWYVLLDRLWPAASGGGYRQRAACEGGAVTEVTILSRRDCHLCEVVIKMAKRVQEEVPFLLKRVDVDSEPGLTQRYGERIPVVLIDQVECASGQVRETELRRAIKRARWRSP